MRINFRLILSCAIYGVLLLGLIGITPFTIQAQQSENVDEIFEQARLAAEDDNYPEARRLSRVILDMSPEYHDVRVFLARTYAWDRRFREARAQLDVVFSEEPNNVEALSARADVELWDRNYRAGLDFANRAIEGRPDDAALYVKRARLYRGDNQFRRAHRDLDRAEALEPDRTDIRTIRQEIEREERRNMAAVGLTYDHYSDDNIEPWQRMFLEYHRLTNRGPVIARLNVGHRFDQTATQFEVDTYPTIGQKWYGYLNVGYSSSDLFPELRFGAELYRSLPKAFEGSIGIRYLKFPDDDVLIYTGTISKYWRDWFFSAKPFFVPQDAGMSTSLNLMARHYFGNPYSYASLSGGFGFSPDERRILDGGLEERLLKSQFIGLLGNYLIGGQLQIFGEVKFTNQQFPFTDDFIQIYTFEMGVRLRF